LTNYVTVHHHFCKQKQQAKLETVNDKNVNNFEQLTASISYVSAVWDSADHTPMTDTMPHTAAKQLGIRTHPESLFTLMWQKQMLLPWHSC